MKIVDFLNDRAIIPNIQATTKEGVIRELVDSLAKAEGIKKGRNKRASKTVLFFMFFSFGFSDSLI